jgi:hypothetical protein
MGGSCAERNDAISRHAALYHLTGAAALLVGSNAEVVTSLAEELSGLLREGAAAASVTHRPGAARER